MTRYKVRIPRSFKYIVVTTVFDGVHPLEYKDHCVWFTYEGYAEQFRQAGYDVTEEQRKGMINHGCNI